MPKSTAAASGNSSARKSLGDKGSKVTKVYTKLSKSEAGTDKVNFYGVIIDAQFPHKSFKSDKYVCSMKITDEGCEVDKQTGCVKYYTLVLFANRFEEGIEAPADNNPSCFINRDRFIFFIQDKKRD